MKNNLQRTEEVLLDLYCAQDQESTELTPIEIADMIQRALVLRDTFSYLENNK